MKFSNLENVLQRKRKLNRTRECSFRGSGGTTFENFSGVG